MFRLYEKAETCRCYDSLIIFYLYSYSKVLLHCKLIYIIGAFMFAVWTVEGVKTLRNIRNHSPNSTTSRARRRSSQQHTWWGLPFIVLPDFLLPDVSCDRISCFSSVFTHILRWSPTFQAHYVCFSLSCRCLYSLQLIHLFLQTPPKYFLTLCLSPLNSISNLCRHFSPSWRLPSHTIRIIRTSGRRMIIFFYNAVLFPTNL